MPWAAQMRWKITKATLVNTRVATKLYGSVCSATNAWVPSSMAGMPLAFLESGYTSWTAKDNMLR